MQEIKNNNNQSKGREGRLQFLSYQKISWEIATGKISTQRVSETISLGLNTRELYWPFSIRGRGL